MANYNHDRKLEIGLWEKNQYESFLIKTFMIFEHRNICILEEILKLL